MTHLNQVKKQAAPLRQQVIQLFRNDILEGIYMPGDRLTEPQLCETYGVSRTVIREVLRQLESEHLVTVIASQGPVVTVLTEKDISSIYVVRANLEGLVTDLFVKNSDSESYKKIAKLAKKLEKEYLNGSVESRENFKLNFYETLIEGADNVVLADMLKGIHARIALLRRFAFTDHDRIKISHDELKSIFEAILIEKDAELAKARSYNHILHAGKLAIDEYKKRISQKSA